MANVKNSLIAKRYSNALLGLVNESGKDLFNIKSQLMDIVEVLNSSVELTSVLSDPVISINSKKDVMTSLLSDKVDYVLINFIKLLLDKDRFGAFREIADEFSELVDKYNNIQKVEVTSAIELREELKIRLADKLASKLNNI